MNKRIFATVFVGVIILALGVGFWLGKISYQRGNNLVPPEAAVLGKVNSVTGTVKKVAKESVFVELALNLPPQEREVLVVSDTKIMKNGRDVKINDLRSGDLVFITSEEDITNMPLFKATTIFVKVSAK